MGRPVGMTSAENQTQVAPIVAQWFANYATVSTATCHNKVTKKFSESYALRKLTIIYFALKAFAPLLKNSRIL